MRQQHSSVVIAAFALLTFVAPFRAEMSLDKEETPAVSADERRDVRQQRQLQLQQLFGIGGGANDERSPRARTTAQKWLATNGVQRTSVCDECQTIIKQIVAVAGDPTKVEELKLLLGFLCKQTSYVKKCELFVSKLDLFIERLLPLMRDANEVCKTLRMCANKRIEHHRAIAQLYASMLYPQSSSVQAVKDIVCDECEFAAHELDSLVQSKKFQKNTCDWLHKKICDRLGEYKGSCDEVVDDFVPEFFSELHDILQNYHKFCVDLEMCEPGQQQTPGAFNRALLFRQNSPKLAELDTNHVADDADEEQPEEVEEQQQLLRREVELDEQTEVDEQHPAVVDGHRRRKMLTAVFLTK